MKLSPPAAERNREPIREVLATVLPATGRVLEIASGSGVHAVTFARAFPHLTWQPSDPDPDARASIVAWRDDTRLPNLEPPLALDVVTAPWPIDDMTIDAIVCINMIHIAPWEAALALFAGAGRVLAEGAPLVTYGPYRWGGTFTAPSNEAFDRSLRDRDPRWGVREVTDLTAAARDAGLDLRGTVAMPANNHVLVFRRTAQRAAE